MTNWLIAIVSRLVQQERRRQGLKLADLSKATGLPISTIVRLEQGVLPDIDLCLLATIGDALEMSLCDLLSKSYEQDFERIVLYGMPEISSLLEASDREIVVVRTERDLAEAMAKLRVDLLITAGRLTSPNPPISPDATETVWLCMASGVVSKTVNREWTLSYQRKAPLTSDEIVMTVNGLLNSTLKGLVCGLKRRNDKLAIRRQSINTTIERLTIQRMRLAAQSERLLSQNRYLNAVAESKGKDCNAGRERVRKILEIKQRAAKKLDGLVQQREVLNFLSRRQSVRLKDLQERMF